MAFGSNLAAVTRVAFEAQTGEFQRDVAQAERRYRQATSGMSDAAIKLELAQARLQRQLARGPKNFEALARAELQVRRAEQELASQSHRTSAALNREEASLGRLSRGALAGSGVLRGLGRSVAFASTAFLGGAGLVYALRSTIDRAAESERVLAQTANAVRRAGLSWEAYGQQVQRAALAQSNLSGFDDERLLATFSLFVRRTRDVNEALRLNALAADVARGRNIQLEQAAQLVLKASIGQAGALRRLGIDARKGADATELLAKLQRQYAGSARAFGETAAGAQERFRVALENTQEVIAARYLPSITRLLGRAADWLNDSRNQERIQRDVNAVVQDGAQLARGFADGLRLVHRIAGPLVENLGGFETVGRALIGLKLASVLRGWAAAFTVLRGRSAGSFAAIAASADATTARVTADAARMEAALDTALRPRTLTVVERIGQYGTPLPGGETKNAPRGGGGFFPAVIGGAAGLLGAAGRFGAYAFSTQANQLPSRIIVRNGRRYFQFRTPDGRWSTPRDIGPARVHFAPGREPTPAELMAGLQGNAEFDRLIKTPSYREQLEQAGFKSANTSPTRPPSSDLPRALVDAALRAQLTASLTDDLAAAQAQESYLRRQLARAKRGSKLYSDILAALVSAHSEVESAQQAIDAEQQRHADALAEQERKRREEAQRRARAYRERLQTREQELRDQVEAARNPAQQRRREDALLAFLRREAEDAKLTRKERERYRHELQQERDKAAQEARADKESTLADAVARAEIAVEKATKGSAAYEKALAAERKALRAEISFEERVAKIAKTAAERRAAQAKARALEKKLAHLDTGGGSHGDAAGEFRRLAAEFLQNLQGTLNTYGGNLFGAGQLHTQAIVQTSLMRRQNELLEGLGRGLRHPGARYARMELTSVADGIGVF